MEDGVTEKQKNEAKINKHYADDAGLELFLSLAFFFLHFPEECSGCCRGNAAADCDHVPSPGNKHQQHQSLVFILQPPTRLLPSGCHSNSSSPQSRTCVRGRFSFSLSPSLFLVLFNCRADSIQDWGGKERKTEEKEELGRAARRIAREAADGFGGERGVLRKERKKTFSPFGLSALSAGGWGGCRGCRWWGVGGDKRCAVPLT